MLKIMIIIGVLIFFPINKSIAESAEEKEMDTYAICTAVAYSLNKNEWIILQKEGTSLLARMKNLDANTPAIHFLYGVMVGRYQTIFEKSPANEVVKFYTHKCSALKRITNEGLY